MNARRTWPVLALLGGLCGCASTWTLRTTEAPFALQWPFQPNLAKLTYVRSLTGVSPGPSAGRALAALAYGKESADTNAFVLPVAVATARDGRIAVADLGRACVHLFLPAQERYLRLTGPKQEPMRTPVALAFDETLRLFVADSGGRVYAFGPDGEPLLTIKKAGNAPLQRPTGLAYSPRSRLLFVVDTAAHTVYVLDAGGTLVRSFGGRGDAAGLFNFPTHIAWAPSGEVLVTDALNFRVQILSEEGKPLGVFGHHGDGSGDLAMPKGVALDRDGVVYVADSIFDVVQLFDRSGRFLLALGRRGVDFGEFWLPAGIFISEKDELYVCDTYNHRVQVFRIAERYAQPPR